MSAAPTVTHETFIARVAALACSRLNDADRALCTGVKLTYGAGPNGVRGITYYNRWTRAGDTQSPVPFVAICATCQEDIWQVAGTTLHELGHVLAGWSAGHGPLWHAACAKLGLRRVLAAGTQYKLAMFDPSLRDQLARLTLPTDGAPVKALTGPLTGPLGPVLRPCPAGRGTRGGKSYSATRMHKFTCTGCQPPMIVRCARDLHATCTDCNTPFARS